MPPTPMPLPRDDFVGMGCSWGEFTVAVDKLRDDRKRHVVNATHRLAEAEWIRSNLEAQVSDNRPPVAQEGLLSLQMYLLLTCVDTLGHVLSDKGPKARFTSFLDSLDSQTKLDLVESILVWKTNAVDLAAQGLCDRSRQSLVYPSRGKIESALEECTERHRFEVLSEFLYLRRNLYTHEAEYPQLGHHPNLSVMQRHRLSVPNTASLGELDRLQVLAPGTNIYFAYYVTDDPIAAIRLAIVQGLASIVGIF